MLEIKYLFGSLLHPCSYHYFWHLFPWCFLPSPLRPHVNRLVEVDRTVASVCNLQTESADPKKRIQIKFLSWCIFVINFKVQNGMTLNIFLTRTLQSKCRRLLFGTSQTLFRNLVPPFPQLTLHSLHSFQRPQLGSMISASEIRI